MIVIQLGSVHFTIIVYLVILVALIYFKPALMFDAAGNPKSFSAHTTATTSPFAPVFTLPLLAILIYFIVSVLSLMRIQASA